MNPLNKIIFLSAFLATGFLLILLSGALFNNWTTLWIIFIYLIAPLPNLIASSIENSRDDFLTFSNDHGNNPTSIQEFCRFITGVIVISGIGLPTVLFRCKIIEFGSMLMSIIGGLIVYVDIIIFIWFFSEEEEENDDFNF
ncbi:vacuolar protein sorting-associated protein 55 [[Candida] jaroonii]|uniref:Vacuolar protein sorting-associated protein 55 n=1 Tax=[Candida] jaroonii TaxID=467808 RepID=A0ACA9Y404_9ASCO|nr:vacuolar protein sorting-associated protein 55 [[Candida] jaroonii]